MLKFIRSKAHHHESEARRKMQEELFKFGKSVEHGFPHRPSAVAYDCKLHILAVGTQNGVIKVYGGAGVEFQGELDEDCSITQLFFLPNRGRIISLCNDNSLHLWEINFEDGRSEMVEVKLCELEGGLKKVSACCLPRSSEHLLIGTEGGNIYLLDVKTFEMTDHIIYQDVVMQNVPDDYKVNPGAVEAIAQHPTNDNKLLIGYNRGLMVLWDNENLNADQAFVGSAQQLESICWHKNGEQFMSSHNDGSYCVWNTNEPSKPEQPPSTPYGPFPCKPITKVLWRTTKTDPLIIFCGGMPRATFGDRYTVSVMQMGEGSSNAHKCFDFTSRIIDFFTITDDDVAENEENEPESLVVLLEEELVVIDLTVGGWPMHRLPYLTSLHASAITCSSHVTNLPDELWDKMAVAGDSQMADSQISERDWPINGGKTLRQDGGVSKDLLMTGHEDGSVRFWDASGCALSLIYKLSTAEIFGEENYTNPAEDEEWPPFKKVGHFDPYSDDPRLGIQKIVLNPVNGHLILAGTAGQVIFFEMESEDRKVEIEVTEVSIVSERDSFVWKGHDKLSLRDGPVQCSVGFQPRTVLQMWPPAACTALALQADWGLIAAGTAHGFTLFDLIQKRAVLTKCTLAAMDMIGTSETPMSRRKSLKKSLRESFRRLRKMRERKGKAAKKEEAKPSPKKEKAEEDKENIAIAKESEAKEEKKEVEEPKKNR